MAQQKAVKRAKKREDLIRVLNWSARVKAIVLASVSAVVFFSIVFSDLGVYFKVALAAADLALTGLALERVTGWQGWAGVLLVRGRRGFEFMEWFGQSFPGWCRRTVDYGLALCFGVPYSWRVFRSRRKVLGHALVQLAVAWFIAEGAKYYLPYWFAGAVVFFSGLLGFGYVVIGFQAVKILTVPKTPAGVMPVIPGVTLPLVEGIIAIAVVATVHELAHGVVCVIEKLELKTSGIVLFGFLPIGAFVEPDEEKFNKIGVMKKRRILVAGSTSNFLFSLLFLVLFQAALAGAALSTGGVKVHSVLANSSAYGILGEGEFILSADGKQVKNTFDLANALQAFSEGQRIVLETDRGEKEIILGPGGKIGITAENTPRKGFEWLFGLFGFLASAFGLTAFLNFALAVFNILPVFITDGYRIVLEELLHKFGKRREALAKVLAKAVGLATLALLAINVLPWFL